VDSLQTPGLHSCGLWFSNANLHSATSQNGSNMQKTAHTLCGTGKLKPEVEAQICTKEKEHKTPSGQSMAV
jgi:hypothetical protein